MTVVYRVSWNYETSCFRLECQQLWPIKVQRRLRKSVAVITLLPGGLLDWICNLINGVNAQNISFIISDDNERACFLLWAPLHLSHAFYPQSHPPKRNLGRFRETFWLGILIDILSGHWTEGEFLTIFCFLVSEAEQLSKEFPRSSKDCVFLVKRREGLSLPSHLNRKSNID